MKSIITNKCPRCRRSGIFCTNNPYDFKNLFLMPTHCDSCGLIFSKEPGFFYGSMYVGYGISIAYLTTIYVGMTIVLGEFELSTYFILAIGSLFSLTPVIFRFSRSVWLSLFEKYDAEAMVRWKKKMEGKEIDNPCIDV